MTYQEPTMLSYAAVVPSRPNQHLLRRGLLLYGASLLATAVLSLLLALIWPLLTSRLVSAMGPGNYMRAQAWITIVQTPLYLALTALTVLAAWWFSAPCGPDFSPPWRWTVRAAALGRLACSILALPLTAVAVYNYFNWDTLHGRYAPAPWWSILSAAIGYLSLALTIAATIIILCHLARLAAAFAARAIRVQLYVVLALSLTLSAAGFALRFFPLYAYVRGGSLPMYVYSAISFVLTAGNLLDNLWLAALVLLLAWRLRPGRSLAAPTR